MKNIQFLKENGVDVDSSIELFGDIDLYNSTMNDFLESIDNKLEKLKTFKDLNEIENYAVFAHSVKSDARYLGFKSVAEVALKHEMAGKEDNQKFIMDDYDFLIQTVHQMIDTVKDYLLGEDNKNIESTNIKKNILVIDDSPLITNLVEKSLKDNYSVISFNDPKESITYILNNKEDISVILLDLNMPILSGFDILEVLKNNNLFEKIKVSIITGDESRETINKAFQYPIIDMLNKPFSVDSLKSVIDKTFI